MSQVSREADISEAYTKIIHCLSEAHLTGKLLFIWQTLPEINHWSKVNPKWRLGEGPVSATEVPRAALFPPACSAPCSPSLSFAENRPTQHSSPPNPLPELGLELVSERQSTGLITSVLGLIGL